MKRFINNPCNLYIFLWCLYLLQGTLYAKGSIISQSALLFIFMMSLYHIYNVIRLRKKPAVVNVLIALLVMFTVYAVILFITDGSVTKGLGGRRESTIGYIKGLYISLFPLFSCYYYAVKGRLNADVLKFWVFIFMFVALSEYLELQAERIRMLAEKGSDSEEVVNNTGYFFLALIPCAMIYEKKPLMQYVVLGFSIVMIILGMKRGAILIAAVVIVIFALYKLKTASKKQKALVIMAILIAIIALSKFIGNFLENSAMFSSRIESTLNGNMSGRETIYMDLLRKYWEANPFQMLFGRGAHGTIKITTNYAHNDWLEMLTNQGVLGVFMYLIYWFSFLGILFNKKFDTRSRITLLMLFVMLGMKTLFSMSIGSMSIYTSCMYGYALADGFGRDKNLL